ncbi:MAG: hypothetical protein AMXMBFR7_45970 [Planctomycetota bacterium]
MIKGLLRICLVLMVCGFCVGLRLGAADLAPAKVSAGWTDGVAIDTVVAPYMSDNLEMAVIPTPRHVQYAGKLLEFHKAAVVIPKEYPHASTLRDLAKLFPDVKPMAADAWPAGGDADLVVMVGDPARNPLCGTVMDALGIETTPDTTARLGKEGYRLIITRHEGKAVALLAGNQPAGDFWAVQTLRQLLIRKAEQAYTAGVWMEDWPTFPARGSKALRNYMPQYKDNFCWGTPSKQAGELLGNFGWFIPTWSPGGSLDCSDAYLNRLGEAFRAHFEKTGVKDFCVKFDDVGASLRSGYNLGKGDIKDLVALMNLVVKAGAAPEPSPAKRLWDRMSEADRALLTKATDRNAKWWTYEDDLINVFSTLTAMFDLYDAASFAQTSVPADKWGGMQPGISRNLAVKINRELLAAALPDFFLPPPEFDTSERFAKYGPAIVYFLTELDKRAKTIDPGCRIWYLPQEYAAPTGGHLARAILEAGGLPKDIALCWTGPQVFSKDLSPDGIRRYMESFGLTACKGLIYDNYARHGDYFAIPREGRSPELAKHLLGIFSENSTALNRITRCDQSWNPEAYNPERALKLACREMSKRNPDQYKRLYDFVQFYESHRTIPLRMTREEKITELKEVNAKLKSLLAALAEVFPEKDPMLKDVTGAIGMRMKKQGRMEAAGYRELTAIRAEQPVTLDGKLDEDCWQKAPVAGGFVALGEKWMDLGPETGVPVPDADSTSVRVCYDDKFLYVAAECHSGDEMAIKTTKADGTPMWWAREKNDRADTGGIWHGPSVELFIAPGGDQMNYYQLVAGIMGATWDKYSGKPAEVWDSGWEVKTTIDKHVWIMEAAIPLSSLTHDPIKKGDLWAANFCRSRPGRQMWTFVYGPGGFHTPEDFGVLKFE